MYTKPYDMHFLNDGRGKALTLRSDKVGVGKKVVSEVVQQKAFEYI